MPIDELKLVLLKMRLLLALSIDEELISDKLKYKICDEKSQNCFVIFNLFIEKK